MTIQTQTRGKSFIVSFPNIFFFLKIHLISFIEKITEWFATRIPTTDLSITLPCLSLMLGIDWPPHPQSNFSSEQTITAIEDILLLMLNNSEPKVIVLENLQWFDEASWGFLPKMIQVN